MCSVPTGALSTARHTKSAICCCLLTPALTRCDGYTCAQAVLGAYLPHPAGRGIKPAGSPLGSPQCQAAATTPGWALPQHADLQEHQIMLTHPDNPTTSTNNKRSNIKYTDQK